MILCGCAFLILYNIFLPFFYFIVYILETLIYAIMPLKILLFILSDTSDNNKVGYPTLLLKQSVSVVLIQYIIKFLPYFDIIPFFSIFSGIIRISLLISIIFVQVPIMYFNHMLRHIFDKIPYIGYFRDIIPAVNFPLANKIIDIIRKYFKEDTLSQMKIISTVVRKYESEDDGIQIHSDDFVNDKQLVLSALDNLGINTKSLSRDFIIDNINKIYSKMTNVIDKCVSYCGKIMNNFKDKTKNFFNN